MTEESNKIITQSNIIKITVKSKKYNNVIKQFNINEFISELIYLDNMNLLSNGNNLLSDIINLEDVLNIIRNNQIQAVPIIINYLELNLRNAFYEEEFELFKKYDIEYY
jgi:hypothetical protein